MLVDHVDVVQSIHARKRILRQILKLAILDCVGFDAGQTGYFIVCLVE